MNIENTLQKFGLGKSKTQVYLAALQIGSGTTQQIASYAHLPRTTVHEILQPLVRLGLISFVIDGRKRIYTAEKPTHLKNLLREKERQLDLILPDLLSLYGDLENHPQVRCFEGLEGIKIVFEDMLTVGSKKLYGIVSSYDLFSTLGKEYLSDYLCRQRNLVVESDIVCSLQKEIERVELQRWTGATQVRYTPQNMTFPLSMYIYDNKIGILGLQKKMFGMIIESSGIYIMIKNLFDVLWKVSLD